jgi:hypothetical protein
MGFTSRTPLDRASAAQIAQLLRSIEAELSEEGITRESDPRLFEERLSERLLSRVSRLEDETQLGQNRDATEAISKLTPVERAQALAEEARRRADRKPSGLLPDRHPTKDFFVADIVDYALKSDMATMEVPTFSLQTKPDMEAYVWQSLDGKRSVRIVPSEAGRATQFDKDLLIYLTSQLVASINRGGPVSKTVRYVVHDYLKTTNRRVDGEEYQRHKNALTRLSGTRIKTNVMTGKRKITDDFAFIDRVRTIEKDDASGRMLSVEVTLSEWLWNAIQAREVLTISPDYFRLRKALERRLYELARKHVGHQSSWRIELASLHEKSGSLATLKEFSRMLRDIIFDGNVPEYQFVIDAGVVTVGPIAATLSTVDNS